MIEKIIVRKALKIDRFYLPGEVLLPPFSSSIMAEAKAGTDTLEVYCGKGKDNKKNPTLPGKPSVQPPIQSIGGVHKSREILFRKFEQLEIPNRTAYKPPPQRGTSPCWFLGRYAPRKRKLLFRKFEKLEG